MIAVAVEAIPTTWVEERDVPFFRIVTDLFCPAFVAGASALLASYDADEGFAVVGGSSGISIGISPDSA